jgi:hypothetical protein
MTYKAARPRLPPLSSSPLSSALSRDTRDGFMVVCGELGFATSMLPLRFLADLLRLTDVPHFLVGTPGRALLLPWCRRWPRICFWPNLLLVAAGLLCFLCLLRAPKLKSTTKSPSFLCISVVRWLILFRCSAFTLVSMRCFYSLTVVDDVVLCTFLEGTCIDLNALHRSVHKQDPKEKENYKEVQNSCSSSSKPSAIHSSPLSKPLPIVAGHQSQTPQSGGRRGGLTAGETAEYAVSQAHRPTPVPTTHPSFPSPATRAMLRFPPKIIFLEINRVGNIITWRRRWCSCPRLLDRSPQPLRW